MSTPSPTPLPPARIGQIERALQKAAAICTFLNASGQRITVGDLAAQVGAEFPALHAAEIERALREAIRPKAMAEQAAAELYDAAVRRAFLAARYASRGQK